MGIYCVLTDLLIQTNTASPNFFLLKIEYSTIGEPETFKQVGPLFQMRGWSGWNDIPLTNTDNMALAFGGNSYQTNQTHSIRLTFYHNPDEDVSKIGTPWVRTIMGFAQSAWLTYSNMGYDNHIYSWDVGQNAYFPAKVSANSFTSSGDIATSGSITATNYTGDWSGPTTDAKKLTLYTTLSSRPSVNNLDNSLSRGTSSFTPTYTNIPRADRYGALINILESGETQNGSSNWLTQIASTTSKELFYRTKVNNGTFSKWEEILKIADDDYFVLDGGTSTTVV